MNNQAIWKIALQQSAYDCNCRPEDFLSSQNIVTRSQPHPLARKYLPLPFACDLVSYGNNIVAQTSDELAPLVERYINSYPIEHSFETPNMHVLDEENTLGHGGHPFLGEPSQSPFSDSSPGGRAFWPV